VALSLALGVMLLLRGWSEIGLWTREGRLGGSTSVSEGVFLVLRSGRLVIYLPKLLLSMCLLNNILYRNDIILTVSYPTLFFYKAKHHFFLYIFASFSICSVFNSHPKRFRWWDIVEQMLVSSSIGSSGKSKSSNYFWPPWLMIVFPVINFLKVSPVLRLLSFFIKKHI